MKISITCMKCAIDRSYLAEPKYFYQEITEEGVFDFVCNNGHRSIVVLQQQKFEILSYMGVFSIEKEMYRDAISSFASCLERLYEFYFKVSARKSGVLPQEISATWKHMSSQSERQYGAFMATYLLLNQRPPNILQRKQTELRNDVIHKGRLPTREQTIQFGQAVLECAFPLLDTLRSDPFNVFLWEIVSESNNERSNPYINDKEPVSILSLPTPLSLNTVRPSDDLTKLIEIFVNPHVR